MPYPECLVFFVYHGGSLWSRTWQSWQPALTKFDSVVISVNGASPEEDLEVIYSEDISRIKALEILVTKDNYSSLEHASFVLKNSKTLHSSEEIDVMVCAHDDLCVPVNIDRFMNTRSRGTAVFGSWLSGEKLKEPSLFFRCLDRKKLNSLKRNAVMDLLRETERRRVRTSISGVVTTLSAYRATLEATTFTLRGGRAEYMLVTHRSVNRVVRSKEPFVQIVEHSAQESRLGRRWHWWFDEAVYQVWLQANGRLGEPFSHLLLFGKLARGISVNPERALSLLKLWTRVKASSRGLPS